MLAGSGRKVFLVLLSAAVASVVAISVAVGATTPPAATVTKTATAKPAKSQTYRRLRREERGGVPEKPLSVDPALAVQCAETGTSEEEIVLPNARLFYRNWQGVEPNPSDTANRATGCLYATGARADLGFDNTIEGESFGQAKGSGDVIAFITNGWIAADGSDDGFQVWNLRAGKRTFFDPACSTVYADCYISDLELSPEGRAAYSACLTKICRVYEIAPGSPRRSVVGTIKTRDRSPALLAQHHRLYWIGSNGRLRSARFR